MIRFASCMCRRSASDSALGEKGTYQDCLPDLLLWRALRHWQYLDFQLCFHAATRSCWTWLALAFSCGCHRSCRRQSRHCLLYHCRSRGDVWRRSWVPCRSVWVGILDGKAVVGLTKIGFGRRQEGASSSASCGRIHFRLLLNRGATLVAS